MLGPQKARTASKIRIPHYHISRSAVGGLAPFMRYRRADGGIHDGSTNRSAGVHLIGGSRMFIHGLMMHRSQQREMLHHLRAITEMLADLQAGHRGIDGIIIGARLFKLGIAFNFRIPSVHMARAATEPDMDAVLHLARRKIRPRRRMQH